MQIYKQYFHVKIQNEAQEPLFPEHIMELLIRLRAGLLELKWSKLQVNILYQQWDNKYLE